MFDVTRLPEVRIALDGDDLARQLALATRSSLPDQHDTVEALHREAVLRLDHPHDHLHGRDIDVVPHSSAGLLT